VRTLRNHVCAVVAAALLGTASAAAFQTDQAVPATGVIEYAFTPGGDAAGLVINTIKRARTAIYVQAFSFTHKAIAQALVDAAARGVEVQVIADQGQVDSGADNVLPVLAAGRAQVFVDTQHGAAHNKVIIVDPESTQAAVVTGSFNFTFAGQYRNAENVLVLRGNRELARAYLGNWRKHRAHATAFSANPPH
jgi:phosphatidylserine/phosphatidylglycerophosphate/cardiolipin synthase-like enzyme